MLFVLSEFWNTFYAIGGFWIGVTGLLIGVFGFAYTIYQVRKTKSAAEAAKLAADEAISEAKRSYRRFVIGQADWVLGVLFVLVENENWEAGAIRADDLAELLPQMSDGSSEVSDLVDLLRNTADTLRRKKKPPATKWLDLRRRLNVYLDRLRSPF